MKDSLTNSHSHACRYHNLFERHAISALYELVAGRIGKTILNRIILPGDGKFNVTE